jgi:hypothetical protein
MHQVGIVFGLLVAMAAMGCTNKLSGDLKVDGKPFALASCRSGEASGFTGVVLNGKSGAELRIERAPGGKALVFFHPSSGATGDRVGACGTITVTRQNSRVNNIYNVEGRVDLNCTGGKHTVVGKVTFKNCH